jgi:hypothetical protein
VGPLLRAGMAKRRASATALRFVEERRRSSSTSARFVQSETASPFSFMMNLSALALSYGLADEAP